MSADGGALLAEMRARGKAGLSRALSAIEARPADPDVTALLDAAFAAPRGHAIGLTGPPGVGKSTLTDALIRRLRAGGASVGVIAVDPSSQRSGGALLGDRTRIAADPEDDGVFLRSMAARDRLGGVAEITFPALVLMRAVFDRVIVETVGIGQSETAIAGLCDTLALCAQPASGDALQFMKAGIMELPDIVLVTKADLGQIARQTAADLKGALSVTGGRDGAVPPVFAVSAQDPASLDDLLDEIARRAAAPGERDGQARAWAEAQIRHRFGAAGLGHGARLVPETSGRPFSALAARLASLEAAFDAAIAAALERP